MLTFGSKVDIYEWFQDMQGWNRMDFLYNLIHLCNPFELRFLGACIEDMAQTDYNTLKDQEIKANNLENLDQFISRCPPVDEFRSHISVCLALLQSSNYKVASRLAVLLDDKLEGHNLEHLMQAGLCAEVEQWMLVLTLAAYHPAFSFEKKLNFRKKLSEYEKLSKERKNSRYWCGYRRAEHAAVKYKDHDEADWDAEIEPAGSMPSRRREMHHQRGYGYLEYVPPAIDTYQGKLPLGNTQDGFNRPQNSRLSTFPAIGPLNTEYVDKLSLSADCSRNSNLIGNKNFQQCGRTNPPPCGAAEPHAMTPPGTENLAKSRNNPSALSHVINYNNCLPSRSTAMQSAVCQSRSCPIATSALPSVMTSVIVQSTSQTPNTSGHFSSANTPRTATTAVASSRQFLVIPGSDGRHSGGISNRSYYEIQNQRSWDRSRSQSGDTTVKSSWKKPNDALNKGPSLGLRASSSVPTLSGSKGGFSAVMSSSFANGSYKDMEHLRDTGSKAKMSPGPVALNPKPQRVSVSAIPRNRKEDSKRRGSTSFNLKIQWSDGVTSECEHSVEDLVNFYKQVSGKTGNHAINTDFLTKQNNQIQERRKQLEEIFNEVVSSTVNGSNIEDVMTFFNYLAQPMSNLPLKKRRSRLAGAKSRVLLDNGSSSSSTTSPPLVNSSKSRLLSPPGVQARSSVSPISGTGSISTSSNLSSPSSVRLPGTTMQSNGDADGHNDVRSDPYLKFSKLDPSGIDSVRNLTFEEKALLNDHISSMSTRKPEDDTGLDVDMGTLSLSSKDGAPLDLDAPNDVNKTMDIKAILDGVARTQSEDEKSGSSRSVPVALEMPNSSIPADDSSSCFSFEFDSATVGPTTRSSRFRTGTTHLDPPPPSEGGPTPFYSSSRYQSEPGRSWSQTDITPSMENSQPSGPPPYFPSRSAPPFPHIAYCTKPFNSENIAPGPVVVECYAMPVQSMPYTVCPAMSTTSPISQAVPMVTQAPAITSPPPSQPLLGQNSVQYPLAVTTSKSGAMYPVSSQFYPIHSMTPSVGVGSSVPHMLSINRIPPATTVVEKLGPTFHKSDLESWGSSTSSDPDSSKVQDGTVTHNFIPAENVVSNRPGVGPHNCYYNPTPTQFQYHAAPKQWIHHPLAPAYSDPTYAINKEGCDYMDYPMPANSNGCLLNGYLDVKTYSTPCLAQSSRNVSGDAPKNMSVISCCNCGRKGHDASICRDPNAVEVLGSGFHLKMSQGK